MSYQNFGGEYQIVKAKAYLVGDLRDLVWQDEYDYYSWTAGTVYQTPVDLTLDVYKRQVWCMCRTPRV